MIMNKCCFVGRLGQKPEAKDAKGRAVMELSVAVGRKKAAKAEKAGTDWVRFTVWDQPVISYLANYFDKGDEIYIESHYQTKEVVGPDGTKKTYGNFVVDSVQKVTWKSTSAGQASHSANDESGIEVEDLGLTGEIPDFE